MLNCEKTILVAYFNKSEFNKYKGLEAFNQFKTYIESQFKNSKEINDDSVIILVIPSYKTEIQLFNTKYPNYEQIKNDAEKILNKYLNKKEL